MMCLTRECAVLLRAAGLLTLTHHTLPAPVVPGVEHRHLVKVMWTSTTQQLMYLVPLHDGAYLRSKIGRLQQPFPLQHRKNHKLPTSKLM